MKKWCPRCGYWIYNPEANFYRSKKTPDGLRSWCKKCCDRDSAERESKYRPTRRQYATSTQGKAAFKKSYHKYHSTIKGHLAQVYHDINRRCNNPECAAYCNYGERGIRNLFTSLDAFRNYVTNVLQVDPRGLQIDRIDNNGNYEKGNIRFVTCKENLKNRRMYCA